MATRKSNKESTAAEQEAKDQQEQTATGSDEDAAKAKESDDKGTETSDVAAESTGVGTSQAPDSDDEDAAAISGDDAVKADIADIERAHAENPEHPEEAVTSGFLPGTDIPVNAPGTEGLPRA